MRTHTIFPILLVVSAGSILMACSAPNNGSSPEPSKASGDQAAPGSDGGAMSVTADGGTATPSEGGARDGAASAPVVACPTDKFSLSPAHGFNYAMDVNHNGTHLETADLNGDHKLDLVTWAAGSVMAFLNKGDGTFDAPVTSKGFVFGYFAVGDVTGDGVADIVNPYRMLPGNGDGTFGIESNINANAYQGSGGNQTLIADLNGDKLNDVLLTNGKIGVLLNGGGGKFGSPVEYGDNFSNRVALGDFNGDGKPDLAAVSNDERIQSFVIYMNAGSGSFSTGTKYKVSTAGTNGSTRGIAVGDFNADGKVDAAVFASPDNYVSAVDIFINKGDGTFDENRVKSYSVSKWAPEEFVAADLNGDGKTDLVAGVGGVGGGAISVLMGKGDGTFAPAVEIGTQAAPINVVVADFLGNGWLGVAAIDNGFSGTNYLNPIEVVLPSCH